MDGTSPHQPPRKDKPGKLDTRTCPLASIGLAPPPGVSDRGGSAPHLEVVLCESKSLEWFNPEQLGWLNGTQTWALGSAGRAPAVVDRGGGMVAGRSTSRSMEVLLWGWG